MNRININGIHELQFALPGTTTATMLAPGKTAIVNAGFNGVNAQTVSYTATSSDNQKLITFNATAAVTLTLPQPGTAGIDGNYAIWLENLNAGIVTVTPSASTIDGQPALALNQNQGVTLFNDGGNWFTVRGIGGSSVTLQTGGVNNSDQTKLNLIEGTNVTLAADEAGGVTISASGGGLTAPVEIDTDNPATIGLKVKGAITGSGAAFVQGTSATASAASISKAFPSDVYSGSAILVCINLAPFGSGVPTGVTDSLGNTYTLLANVSGAAYSSWIGIYGAFGSAAGANTVSVSLSASTSVAISIHEYSGVASASPLDASANVHTQSSPSTCGPVTTTVAADLLFSMFAAPFFTSASAAGYTTRETVVNSGYGAVNVLSADAQAATVGSYSVVWSGTWNSNAQGAILLALKSSPTTQLVDLQQWLGPTGTVLSSVNSSGKVVLATTAGTPTDVPVTGASCFDPATNTLYIYGSAGWKSVVLA